MELKIESIQRAIDQVFPDFPNVVAIYLFGSVARGTPRADSDLDLALVTTEPLSPKQKLDMYAALTKYGLDRIDLVVLDGTDIVVRFEAVTANRLLYAREGFDHGSFFSRAIREYLDFEPTLVTQRAALKQRLLGA